MRKCAQIGLTSTGGCRDLVDLNTQRRSQKVIERRGEVMLSCDARTVIGRAGESLAWASVGECPPSGTRAARLLGRVWWSASAVEDVDLGDFAVSHREDGPRCVWHASRCATALPVAASHVEGAQRLSARPDMHTGASVKATPPGFNLLDSRRHAFSTLFRGSPNEMPAIESPGTISRFFGCVELDGESPWLPALAAWCDEEQPTSAAGAKSSTHNAAMEATRRVTARECRSWRSKGSSSRTGERIVTWASVLSHEADRLIWFLQHRVPHTSRGLQLRQRCIPR